MAGWRPLPRCCLVEGALPRFSSGAVASPHLPWASRWTLQHLMTTLFSLLILVEILGNLYTPAFALKIWDLLWLTLNRIGKLSHRSCIWRVKGICSDEFWGWGVVKKEKLSSMMLRNYIIRGISPWGYAWVLLLFLTRKLNNSFPLCSFLGTSYLPWIWENNW